MKQIEFISLDDVDQGALIRLMNDPKVGRYLPLLQDGFSEHDCLRFLESKRCMWGVHGFGPYAFIMDGSFAGWGGFQPEGDDEADFALVLKPEAWGQGMPLFKRLWVEMDEQLKGRKITILLPPARPNTSALGRYGFIDSGLVDYQGVRFRRFVRETE